MKPGEIAVIVTALEWIGVDGLLLSGEVEGRREVASLEVVGRCGRAPLLAAVLVRAFRLA